MISEKVRSVNRDPFRRYCNYQGKVGWTELYKLKEEGYIGSLFSRNWCLLGCVGSGKRTSETKVSAFTQND